MLYVSQLSLLWKDSLVPKNDMEPNKYEPRMVEYTPIKLPDMKGRGLLVLPKDFDSSKVTLTNLVKIQSLTEENRVIIVPFLDQPAVIQ